ncbi:uncharacterized protein RBU33_024617 isoform 1-T1 [Hipposideros larvatus]
MPIEACPPGWWVVAEPAELLLSDRERSGLQLRDVRVLRIWSQRVETFVFPQEKYSGPPKISLSFRPIQHQGNRQTSTENTKVYNYALSSLSKLRVFKQLRRG